MKQRIFFLFLLNLFIFSSLSSFAQPKLKLLSIQNLPAHLKIDSTYTNFVYHVKNIGNQTLNDKPVIYFKTDTMSNFAIMYYGGTLPNVNIAPGATAILPSPYFKVEKTAFKVGKNIVVIWPSALAVPPAFDTTVMEMTAVPASVGVEEIKDNSEISVYPVPARDLLNIRFLKKENVLEHVRILDILGKEVYSSPEAVSSINTSRFPTGVYFLYFQFKNRPSAVYRFSKE
jgi:hypothetical protein